MSPGAVVMARPQPCYRWATKHERLTAVVVERFPGESAIESFEAQARDVEEPQPFALVADESERLVSTIVQGDVDSVIAEMLEQFVCGSGVSGCWPSTLVDAT